MQRTKVRRWTKGPHDRLHISTIPSGAEPSIDIGWFDLRTQRQQITIPGMVAEFDAAINWWRRLPKGQQAAAFVDDAGDLATTPAATQPRQRAQQLRPGVLGRLLARLAGQPTPDQSWRVGAAGEDAVAARLDTLTRRGWHVLHSIDTGAGDIDHLAIGPHGVYVINTKHHRGARVDVTDRAITVNGHRQPYPAEVSREAALARAALTAALGRPIYVAPLIVMHGHHSLSGWRTHTPTAVRVLPSWAIAWWARLPGRTIHNRADIDQIYTAARLVSTWKARPAPRPTPAQPHRAAANAAAPTVGDQRQLAGGFVLEHWPPGPADQRHEQWRGALALGTVDDMLNAREIAEILGIALDELNGLIDASIPHWKHKGTVRPPLPRPCCWTGAYQDAEWFRSSLALHFGVEPAALRDLRSVFDDD